MDSLSKTLSGAKKNLRITQEYTANSEIPDLSNRFEISTRKVV